MQQITLIQPDDFHVHFRDGVMLTRTVKDTAMFFRRAIAMPNLNPPIRIVSEAKAYEKRIQSAIPKGVDFTPLMSLYLTDETTPNCVKEAKRAGIIGFKLYPAHATTHSQFGVTHIEKLDPVFEMMQAVDLPLLIHGEIVNKQVDIFDREAVFIDQILIPMIKKFPQLRIILEHITTEEAVQFIESTASPIAATITAHHLWINRNDLLVGGIHPHLYCLPVPKRERHRQALIKAATSGNPKFFLGTDSALHVQSQKESSCGCAGIYTSFSALPLYAEIFSEANALEKLENFASVFGADFYQLPRNESKITLIRAENTIPESLPVGSEAVIPFKAGEKLNWLIKGLFKIKLKQ